jgi:hypothetical protein
MSFVEHTESIVVLSFCILACRRYLGQYCLRRLHRCVPPVRASAGLTCLETFSFLKIQMWTKVASAVIIEGRFSSSPNQYCVPAILDWG